MKDMSIQIHRPELLLTLGIVLVNATLVLGGQLDPTTGAGQCGETLNQSVNELPAQRFDGTFETFAPTVKRVSPAVVRIVTALKSDSVANLAGGMENPLSRYSLGKVPRLRSARLVEGGLGSGVIVTEDGYILTNSHLVNGATEVEVTLQDGREFKAKLIGLDPKSDIAVIKIDAHNLPSVPLADSRKVQVGDLVLAIGNPFGVGQTVTHGIVSATDRGGMGIEDYESFIQTDAPINPGNSGGALVDVTGHLIGINTAILSSSGGNLGIGFAVPSELAHKVMTDLVKYGYVVRGYLGVDAQDLTPELATEFKLQNATGVLVGGVSPNGPAEQAGIKVGDVISRFDGREALDARQLMLSVAEAKPGQIVPVEVVRDGSSKPLRVTIGNPSSKTFHAKVGLAAHERNPGTLQGVFIGELNSELRQQLEIPSEVQGAVVFDLYAASAAAQAGLRPGDVIQSINRQEVQNDGEALRLTQNAKEKRTLLRVWSKSGNHFILIEGLEP
ncbi:MAG: Do family serine endopeptidase [Verrucomicrobiota bacterium]|jgi:serine protease Do